MRALRAVPVTLVLAALAGVAGPASGQSADLPELTTEQRWQRAAMHASLFGVVMLRQAAEQGKTATDVANDMVALFGPGWSGVTTPLAMARAIRTNWMLWPDAGWELLESSDDRVRFRMNRPWRGIFGDSGVLYDVPEADLNTWLRLFHEGIARRQGMTYTQTEDGDWLVATIVAR